MKKLMITVLVLLFAFSVFAEESKVDKAVAEIAGDVKMTECKVKLTKDDIAAIQEKMDSKAPVNEKVQIYKGEGAVVVVESQEGKWGPIVIAVLIDSKTNTVKDIKFISDREKRGKGMKSGSFYKQFFDKGLKDDLDVKKGIKAVSGATVSSRAVAKAVQRALAVAELSGTICK